MFITKDHPTKLTSVREIAYYDFAIITIWQIFSSKIITNTLY